MVPEKQNMTCLRDNAILRQHVSNRHNLRSLGVILRGHTKNEFAVYLVNILKLHSAGWEGITWTWHLKHLLR